MSDDEARERFSEPPVVAGLSLFEVPDHYKGTQLSVRYVGAGAIVLATSITFGWARRQLPFLPEWLDWLGIAMGIAFSYLIGFRLYELSQGWRRWSMIPFRPLPFHKEANRQLRPEYEYLREFMVPPVR